MTPVSFIRLYARAALARTKNKCSLRNGKLKANRASETEEQGKEKLKDAKKIGQEGYPKITRGKEMVKNRRPRETAPGHSQKIEAKCCWREN